MEVDGGGLVELELKYCERCGSLWLRRPGSEEVYCISCAPKMSALPTGRKPAGGGGFRVKDDVSSEAQEDWTAVCAEGGNA